MKLHSMKLVEIATCSGHSQVGLSFNSETAVLIMSLLFDSSVWSVVIRVHFYIFSQLFQPCFMIILFVRCILLFSVVWSVVIRVYFQCSFFV